MTYEEEILHARFEATAKEVQRAINYFCAINLTGIPESILSPDDEHMPEMEKAIRWSGVYEGIAIELQFPRHGAKQHWIGATFAGSGPFARHEHNVGYIEINPIKVTAETPVDVRIMSGWKPFSVFFADMAEHLNKVFGASAQVYQKSLTQESSQLDTIQAKLDQIIQMQADTHQIVTSLRHWARHIQQAGLPLPSDLQANIATIADDSLGAKQYLEVTVPLIPGILAYKVELGSEHTVSLRAIWTELLRRAETYLAATDSSGEEA